MHQVVRRTSRLVASNSESRSTGEVSNSYSANFIAFNESEVIMFCFSVFVSNFTIKCFRANWMINQISKL